MIQNEQELDRLMEEAAQRLNLPKTSLDQSIFNQACTFHEGALRCAVDVKGENGVINTATVPTITCCAFAVELYMKSLLGPESIKTHKLDELFKYLPQHVRNSIYVYYKQLITGRTFKDLEEDIKQLASAFVDWRYIYEQGKIAIALHRLIALAYSLHMAIRQLKPEWDVHPYLNAKLATKPDLSLVRIISFGGSVMIRMQVVQPQ